MPSDALKSIILRDAEVRSVQAGRATVRRAIKLREFQGTDTPGYDFIFRDRRALWNDFKTEKLLASKFCPFKFGERKWVKESFRVGDGMNPEGDPTRPTYRADWPEHDCMGLRWDSPALMGNRFSRLTVQIIAVRVEKGADGWEWVVEMEKADANR